jgi:hypothetical protein
MKKNCNNCKWLEYFGKDNHESSDSEGFSCNHRRYKTAKAEENHEKQLDSEKYRSLPKKCCQLASLEKI